MPINTNTHRGFNLMGGDQVQQAHITAQQNAARAASQKLLDEAGAAAQRQHEQTMRENALAEQQRLLQNHANPRTTDGARMQVSNAGDVAAQSDFTQRSSGQTSRGGGGVAIGGGVFPDVSQLMNQIQSQLPPVQALQRAPAPQVPQNTGAFARAKDVSGRVGNKAIDALRNSMTQRGISDSGLAAMGEAGILGDIARQQADAEYQEASVNTGRQWDANQLGYQGALRENAMDYQGSLSQRNQSLQALMQLMGYLY